MTARQVEKATGGVGRLSVELSDIAKKHDGVSIWGGPHLDDNEPDEQTNSFYNIIFEIVGYNGRRPATDEENERLNDEMDKAIAEVGTLLIQYDLSLYYECSGDGDNGVILSYRVGL